MAWSNESKAQWSTAFHGTDQNDAITGMSFFTPSNGYAAFQKFTGYTQDGGKTAIPGMSLQFYRAEYISCRC